jgi:hypothetical protein
MGQSGAKSDPARNAIIINNNDTCNEERNKEKIEYDTYIFCEYLAVVPWPVEEKGCGCDRLCLGQQPRHTHRVASSNFRLSFEF